MGETREQVSASHIAAVVEPSASRSVPSLADLYRRHVAFVWRTLRRFAVADADLEDATHEVFLVLHRRLADYDGRAAITTWLYGIARGVARNHIRGARRADRKLRLVAEQPTGHAPPVDEQLDRAHLADAVAQFLTTLDDDKRAVFELSEIEGLTGPEIARALRLNPNTVSTRLRRARKRFRAFAQRLKADLECRSAGHGG